MTYQGSSSEFRSTAQAEAIANILNYMSGSDAYDEEAQSKAKQLANSIRRYIKENTILTTQLTYSKEAENILSEAFDIYVEAKRGQTEVEGHPELDKYYKEESPLTPEEVATGEEYKQAREHMEESDAED